jgi:hypothetical protein
LPRRISAVLLVAACAAGVVAYQMTRSTKTSANPRPFVPSPGFFLDFSPSFRTSIADAYYLGMMQYYGTYHGNTGKLSSLPLMTDLVTSLSPKFATAYFFGSFALVDAGHPEWGYALLRKGFKENPRDWRFPIMLGFFAYHYGLGSSKTLDAAKWYQEAAAIPGSPDYVSRLAAVLLGKGGETEKAVLLWGQVYVEGDKYSRQKAVDGLDRILPEDKTARMKAVAPLYATMPKAGFEALIAELFKDYVQ